MRITNAMLDGRVKYLNEVTGNASKPYTNNGSSHVANIGNYHISSAYGGVELERMYNSGGGITTISHDGYGTKKQLYAFLNAFIDGINLDEA